MRVHWKAQRIEGDADGEHRARANIFSDDLRAGRVRGSVRAALAPWQRGEIEASFPFFVCEAAWADEELHGFSFLKLLVIFPVVPIAVISDVTFVAETHFWRQNAILAGV